MQRRDKRHDKPAPKTADTRAQEAGMIASQLRDLGLPDAELGEILAAVHEFAAQGVPITRTWKFSGVGVAVTLLLSTRPHIISYARVHRV